MSKKEDIKGIVRAVSYVLVPLLFAFAVWFGYSWMEARTYNKLVKPTPRVTAVDAMFVELRVQDCE